MPEERGTQNVYAVRFKGFRAVRDYIDSFWDVALARLETLAERMIVKSIVLRCELQRAFALFTERAGRVVAEPNAGTLMTMRASFASNRTVRSSNARLTVPKCSWDACARSHRRIGLRWIGIPARGRPSRRSSKWNSKRSTAARA